MRVMPKLWGGEVTTSDRGYHRTRLCTCPRFIFKLPNTKIIMPVTDDGHIYWPPVWNQGSYVLQPLFNPNIGLGLIMTQNYTIQITTDKNNGQTRGILKYAVIRNSMPLWIGQGSCTANKWDTWRIDHYPVAWESATALGTNMCIYPFWIFFRHLKAQAL